MASSFIKGLKEKLSILAGDWLIMQPDAEEDTAYKIKKSNVISDATEPNTWYVSTNGDDSKVGSDKFPFENISAAIAVYAAGDIIQIIDEGYSSNENITISKKTIIRGPVANITGGVAFTKLQGTWTIDGAGISIIFENLTTKINWASSVEFNLDVILGAISGSSTFPVRLTNLLLHDSFYSLGVNSNLKSFACHSCTGNASDLQIGRIFNFDSTRHFGSITAGLDAATTSQLKNSSISNNLTITGDLTKENSTVGGTETVSGSIDEVSQADDKLDRLSTSNQGVASNVAFEKQVRGGSSTVAFSATKTFSMDNGNFQKMPVTAAITSLAISDDLNGHAYWIMLEIGGAGSYTIPQAGVTFGTRTDNSVDDSVASWFPTTVGSKIMYTIARDPDGEKIYSIETITA